MKFKFIEHLMLPIVFLLLGIGLDHAILGPSIDNWLAPEMSVRIDYAKTSAVRNVSELLYPSLFDSMHAVLGCGDINLLIIKNVSYYPDEEKYKKDHGYFVPNSIELLTECKTCTYHIITFHNDGKDDITENMLIKVTASEEVIIDSRDSNVVVLSMERQAYGKHDFMIEIVGGLKAGDAYSVELRGHTAEHMEMDFSCIGNPHLECHTVAIENKVLTNQSTVQEFFDRTKLTPPPYIPNELHAYTFDDNSRRFEKFTTTVPPILEEKDPLCKIFI